jgi:hypothetical protein
MADLFQKVGRGVDDPCSVEGCESKPVIMLQGRHRICAMCGNQLFLCEDHAYGLASSLRDWDTALPVFGDDDPR